MALVAAHVDVPVADRDLLHGAGRAEEVERPVRGREADANVARARLLVEVGDGEAAAPRVDELEQDTPLRGQPYSVGELDRHGRRL
jgi:hypothetical protein